MRHQHNAFKDKEDKPGWAGGGRIPSKGTSPVQNSPRLQKACWLEAAWWLVGGCQQSGFVQHCWQVGPEKYTQLRSGSNLRGSSSNTLNQQHLKEDWRGQICEPACQEQL